MRRALSVPLAAVLVLWAVPALAQVKATAQNVPEIPYDSVPNFLKLPPGRYLGEAIGVATNSKGHIFVYFRSANTRLWEFDKNGTFVKEIGKGYYGFEFTSWNGGGVTAGADPCTAWDHPATFIVTRDQVLAANCPAG